MPPTSYALATKLSHAECNSILSETLLFICGGARGANAVCSAAFLFAFVASPFPGPGENLAGGPGLSEFARKHYKEFVDACLLFINAPTTTEHVKAAFERLASPCLCTMSLPGVRKAHGKLDPGISQIIREQTDHTSTLVYIVYKIMQQVLYGMPHHAQTRQSNVRAGHNSINRKWPPVDLPAVLSPRGPDALIHAVCLWMGTLTTRQMTGLISLGSIVSFVRYIFMYHDYTRAALTGSSDFWRIFLGKFRAFIDTIQNDPSHLKCIGPYSISRKDIGLAFSNLLDFICRVAEVPATEAKGNTLSTNILQNISREIEYFRSTLQPLIHDVVMNLLVGGALVNVNLCIPSAEDRPFPLTEEIINHLIGPPAVPTALKGFDGHVEYDAISSLLGHLHKFQACARPGCPKRDNLRTCAGCKAVKYCSTECQKAHWRGQFHNSNSDAAQHRLSCRLIGRVWKHRSTLAAEAQGCDDDINAWVSSFPRLVASDKQLRIPEDLRVIFNALFVIVEGHEATFALI
ncbi:hypothetical protein FISHEDRAFT_61293 [Fistulina hepatica ATCC 64428]|uniref:MYND-type domain-containing protein n=1 Tax=Fistulina hepatica ATCC 64428 TaxID=1128425 RepID=A0A0D7A2R4_9AGAR|nr:hypothetical protein FISHEDRAFT_61293 [Fistulina hepatica ATCC 64428]